MITFKRVAFTLDTASLTGMIADNVEAVMREEVDGFTAAIKDNVPSPSRPTIHIYATGAMRASIRGEVDTSQPIAAMVFTGDSRSAPYADEGYTKSGKHTARSWDERGVFAHGDRSYMQAAVEPLLGDLAAKILQRAKTQMEG